MAEGIARAGFDIDLLEGKAKEGAFARILCRATVECKSDEQCIRGRGTQNLFVEFKQKGRPSGLATTTADWWAFEYDDKCWIIVPTERLRAVAKMAYAHGMIAKGGDNNLYEGVLVPIEWLVTPWHSIKRKNRKLPTVDDIPKQMTFPF